MAEGSSASWIQAVTSIITAVLGFCGIQAGLWWKAYRQRQDKAQTFSSEFELARIAEDGDANRQLFRIMKEDLEDAKQERDKAKEGRESAIERNIKLSRAVALSNWYNNMLIAYIKQHNLPVPARPADIDSEVIRSAIDEQNILKGG